VEQKTDLRIIKTHKALREAFSHLLGEKKFEAVTVNELCDRAMVRRATFYKHFADKYEFFAFVIREILAKFDTERVPGTQNESPVEFYTSLFSHMLAFVEENKRLVRSAMESSLFPVLLSVLSEQVELDIRLKLKSDQALGHKMVASPEVMAVMSAGAVVGLLRWWLSQETPIPRESLRTQVAGIINALYTTANQ